jgi:hypothetical protein
MHPPRENLDAEETFALWRKLAGPTPRLFVPASIRAEARPGGPWFQVYLKHSELYSTKDLTAEYIELLSTGSMDAIGNIAMINNYLVIAPTSPATHERLTYYLRQAHLERIAQLTDEHPVTPPHVRVIFSRIGCLITIKLLFAAWTEHEEPTLNQEDIGDLALRTNDFLKKDPLGPIRDPDLLLEFLANWDLTNTADIAHSMARTDIMLRDHLPSDNPRIATLRNRLNIDWSSLDSCSIPEHYAHTFSLYSGMADAIKKNGACLVGIEDVKASLNMNPDHVEAFFRAHSNTLEGFHTRIAASFDSEPLSEAIHRDEFLMDMRMFRSAPLLRLNEHTCLVLDLDYLVELSTAGIYWHFWNQLAGTQQQDLSDMWGHIFEAYGAGLLGHYYPAASGLLRTNITYDLDGAQPEVDALIDLDSTVILFEFKSSKLRTEDIRSRDEERVTTDLQKKYVGAAKAPKGVRQLVRDAQAITRRQLPRAGRTIPVHVFPVLVSEEPLLASLGVNEHLNDVFRSLLDPDCAATIRPLTVMSIEELEMILPHVTQRQPSWQYLLGSRFEADRVRQTSVFQALWDLRAQEGLPRLPNQYILERWEALFTEMGPLIRQPERL